jgi:UDPglucose 6-dehydrogenase
MKITIIGAGYVGLVTGACFAQKDNIVTIVENNHEKIETLLAGKIPFYEPGLSQLVQNALDHKKIVFVNSIEKAMVSNPEIIFSCVGTPSMPDGSADLSFVFTVAKEIGTYINDYCLFINKSTVPVGVGTKVTNIISDELKKRNKNTKFDFASNPEFLREGTAISDFLYPDRVVVGVESQKAHDTLYKLYTPFLKSKDQFLSMNITSAELTKYASNAMLATRISFINQLAILSDEAGTNIEDVKKGMAKDPRIGTAFLNSGVGYGGSCFPKDVNALVHMGKKYCCPMTIVQEVEAANENQKEWFVKKICNHYKNNLSQKTVGIWGLAFKTETDDIRSAPSIDIINKLLKKNVRIIAYDPIAQNNFQKLFGNRIDFAISAKEVLQKSDCLLLLTEWKEFTSYNLQDFLVLKDKTIFDGRNCFNHNEMQKTGITYIDIGRNIKSKQSTQVKSITKKIQTTVNL